MNNEKKKTILYNILFIEEQTKQKGKSQNRNILNKWFQDNTKAFMMRVLAGTLLVDQLEMRNNKEVQEHITMNGNPNLPMYLSSILKYFELIIINGLERQLERKLLRIVNSENRLIEMNDLSNYNFLKSIRNSFVSALLYSYFQLYQDSPLRAQGFNNFFDIWNETFPDHPIEQKRRNVFQMRKEQVVVTQKRQVNRKQSNQESYDDTQSSQTLQDFSINAVKDEETLEESFNENTNQTQEIRKRRKSNKIDFSNKNQLDSDNTPESIDISQAQTKNTPLSSQIQGIPLNNNKKAKSKQSEEMNSLYYTFIQQNQIQEESSFFIEELEQEHQNIIFDFEQTNTTQLSKENISYDLSQVEYSSDNNTHISNPRENNNQFILGDLFSNYQYSSNQYYELEQQQLLESSSDYYCYQPNQYQNLDLYGHQQSTDQYIG